MEICEELAISKQSLENSLTTLRKKNVIINNQLSPFYIPELEKDAKKFTINFNFHINYDG